MSTHQYVAPFYAVATPVDGNTERKFGPYPTVRLAIARAEDLIILGGWEEIDVTNAFGYSTGDL